MATNAHTTSTSVDESLDNALWFIRNRRFIMALETLRSAFAVSRGDVKDRIGRLVADLENAPVALLAV